MYCKNCGTQVKSNDKFCPTCGSKIVDSFFKDEEKGIDHAPLQNDVSAALNKVFSSMEFLIACVCLSVAILFELFSGDVYFSVGDDNYTFLSFIAPIVCLVFLWMIFINARNQGLRYNTLPMKVLGILSKFQVLITWATLGAYVLTLIIASSIQSNIDNLEALESVFKLFAILLLLGSTYNHSIFLIGLTLTSSLFGSEASFDLLFGSATDNLAAFLVITGVIIVALNIIITRNLSKCASALLDSLSTGKPSFYKTGFANIALFITAGIFLVLLLVEKDYIETSAVITYLAYAGFMASMGLAMNKVNYEFSLIKD